MKKSKAILVFALTLSYTILVSYPIQSKNKIPRHVYMGLRNAAHPLAEIVPVEKTDYKGVCGEFFNSLKNSWSEREIELHVLDEYLANQYEDPSSNPRSNGLEILRKPQDIEYSSSSKYLYDLECGPNSRKVVNLKVRGQRLGKKIETSEPFYETELRLITEKKYAKQLIKAQNSEEELLKELNRFELIAIKGTTTELQLKRYQSKNSEIKIKIIELDKSEEKQNLRTKAYHHLISEGEGERPKALITDSLIAISLYEKGVQSNFENEDLIDPLEYQDYTIFPTDPNIKLPVFTPERYVILARRDPVGQKLIRLFNEYIINNRAQIQKDLDNIELKSLEKIEQESGLVPQKDEDRVKKINFELVKQWIEIVGKIVDIML